MAPLSAGPGRMVFTHSPGIKKKERKEGDLGQLDVKESVKL